MRSPLSLVPVPGRLPTLRTRVPHHGAVVVVTGASSGIGEATALRVARDAHHVVLVARRKEVLEEVAERCREAGAASVTVEPTDVSDDDAVAAAIERTIDQQGGVDAVLHCAGEVTYGRVEEATAATFDQVLATNLSGSANIARHTIRHFRGRRQGVLVVVGSLLGYVAIPEMTPYVVSKWGVRALCRQLVIENHDLPDLHVSHVSPGSVDTPIYDNALDAAGGVNSPPPPTISPEAVADAVVRQLRHPTTESQTALSNYAVMWAFRGLPTLWDTAIGPVFEKVSRKSR